MFPPRYRADLRGRKISSKEPSQVKEHPTVRPLARDLRVLIGWQYPLGFGLDGRLLLARRGRVYV